MIRSGQVEKLTAAVAALEEELAEADLDERTALRIADRLTQLDRLIETILQLDAEGGPYGEQFATDRSIQRAQ